MFNCAILSMQKYFMHDDIEISQMPIPSCRNNSTSEVGAEEMSSLMTYGIFFPSQVLETFSEVLTITNNFSHSLVQYFLYEIRESGQKIVTVDTIFFLFNSIVQEDLIERLLNKLYKEGDKFG